MSSSSALPVIVNRNGGTASRMGDKLESALRDAFAAAATEADIQLLDGKDMPDAIARAAAASGRVVVAGGDGTAACAAGQLAGSDAELALLPLGTLNHLARDLGLPDKLEDAAKVAANGTATAIDVAEVNGAVFVNNASVGLYPVMVRERDGQQAATGLPKWLAAVPAAWAALARLPHHRLTLDFGDERQTVVTPLLFVGNNPYSLAAGKVGQRDSLRDGTLSVYAVSRRGRFALVWFALRALVGRAERKIDFATIGESETLTVRSSSRSIDVALDGEIRRFATPLKFRIRPGALTVVLGEATKK